MKTLWLFYLFKHIRKPSILANNTFFRIQLSIYRYIVHGVSRCSRGKTSTGILQRINSRESTTTVEKLVKGDGSETSIGLVLDAGVYYGCSSLSGGRESYFPIDIRSWMLRIRTFSKKMTFQWRTITCIATEENANESHGTVTVDIRSVKKGNKSHRATQKIVDFLNKMPGCESFIGGPGDRSKTANELVTHCSDEKGLFIEEKTIFASHQI